MDKPLADLEPALATDLLRREHAQLAAEFACYAAALAADAERASLAYRLVKSVARHLATERRMLYPLVRHEADELVQALIGQQARIQDAMDAVFAAADDDARDTGVAHLARLVSRHAAEEEKQLFPLVEPRLPNTLRRLRADLDRERGADTNELAAQDALLVFTPRGDAPRSARTGP